MNERKKTVVILTPGFPKDEQDSTCMPFLQDFCTSFMKMYPQFNLRIIAFQYPHKRGHYIWKGLEVYSAGGKSKKNLGRFLVWNRAWKELKKIKKKDGIEVIHSLWLTECTLIGQKFAKRYNIRQVAYAIGQEVLKTNRYLSLIDLNKMRVVAMSQALADKLKASTGFETKNIIAGGVDMRKIVPSANKTVDIIGVGALTELKNYSLFIDVINELKIDFPNIRACIIGKGEQEQQLKDQAGKYGLTGNIDFVGEVEHKEVFSYLSKSKIFLHTSSYEGQSTVMMEALAAGLTVVCFDVGRLHAEGKVSVCKDKNEMVQQIKKLLSSKLDYVPALNRTADDMVKDFVKAYEL
jgi:glycosyltransferase involved in cell wall biosynthesis